MIRSQLLSRLPDLRHGFGTRNGVETPADVVTVLQVHGTELLMVNEETPSPLSGEGTGEGGFDILMTDRRGIAIGIKTADCLPILIAESVCGIVTAVHAGWRGTSGRVVEKAVQRIVSMGGKIENLAVALGPCMGGRCYEVEEDVASVFEKAFPSWNVLARKSEAKWLLDLPETNRLQLISLGVRPEQIDRIDLCTHCRSDLFHSYRRDGEKAGRMVNFIEWIPGAKRATLRGRKP